MRMEADLTADEIKDEPFTPTITIGNWYEQEEDDESEKEVCYKDSGSVVDISCQNESNWELSERERTDGSFWETLEQACNTSTASEQSIAGLHQEKEPFIEKLRAQLYNLEATDLEIIVNTRKFRCHSIVLYTSSKYFSALATNHLKTVVLPPEHVSELVFERIYKWLLFNNRTYETDLILDLLRAARFLQIDELVDSCWSCLESKQNFNEFEAFILFVDARRMRITDVQSVMLTRFSYCFLSMLTQSEFYDLKADEVCQVISSHNLAVQSETEVFYAVVLWVNHDFEKRLAFLPQLMTHVRFPLMSQYFLMRLSVCKVCEDVQSCLTPVVRAMIRKAMCCLLQKQYECNRPELHGEPHERLWVKDPCCRYLEQIKGCGIATFTLDMFMAYLCDINASNYETHYKTLQRTDRCIEDDSDESDWSELPFFNAYF